MEKNNLFFICEGNDLSLYLTKKDYEGENISNKSQIP